MIEILLGLVPFVVGVLMARRLARRGILDLTRLRADPHPPAVKQPSATSSHLAPIALMDDMDGMDDTGVREMMPAAWTALDDLQLNRLLKEASS